jgi:predicted ester cyclase
MSAAAPKPAPLTAEQKIKFYQDGWAAFNAKDWAKFGTVWADDATHEELDMGPAVSGKDAVVEKGAKNIATAFPDATGELELTLLNGNNLASVVLFRGTNKGVMQTPMGEMPPTNKKVGYLMAHLIELNDSGKAQHEWIAADGGTMMGQLGTSPAPHRKVMETGWTDKPVVVATGSDGEKANVASYGKAIDALNKHDVAGTMADAADDVVMSDLAAPADRTGKKEVSKGLEEFMKAFPDLKFTVPTVWGAGDYVVAVGSWSGTNTGDMPSMKLKKTGKPVTCRFVEVDKFQGGKLKNFWIFSNGASMAMQLGLGPKPKAEAKKPEPKPAAAAPAAAKSAPAAPAAAKAPPMPAAPAAALPKK